MGLRKTRQRITGRLNASLQSLIDRTLSIVVIDYTHNRVHEGKHWTINQVDADLDSTQSLDILITPTKALHLDATCETSTTASLFLYEAPTTADGTPITANPNNRDNQIAFPGAAVLNPTVSDTGTMLENHTGGSAGGAFRIGTTGSTRHEWILKANTKYLLRCTSLVDNNRIAFDAYLYEVT